MVSYGRTSLAVLVKCTQPSSRKPATPLMLQWAETPVIGKKSASKNVSKLSPSGPTSEFLWAHLFVTMKSMSPLRSHSQTAIIVAQMPWILKAFFGYLGALPVYYYRQKAFKFLVPVICDRMANLKRMRDDPSFRFEAPDDLITWATQASIGSPETVANSPEHLAVFMLILVSHLTSL